MSRPHPAAVVVLAAGQGTRMKSEIPKVLHSVCGRTLLGHAITAARGLDPEHVVVVVRHERDLVAAHATECDPAITVVVTAGDTPLLSSQVLADLLVQHEGNAVTVLTAVVADATGYGRILRDVKGVISGVVEHKDATPEQREISEINTSTYVFDAAFLREAIGGLDTENAQGEMYLTDVVAKAYEANAGVGSYVVEDSWLVEGCNDLVQLAALREQMNRRTLEGWMRAGAAVVDPATTSIDVTVTLAPDSRILPGTGLYGTTSIAKGAVVGPGEFTNARVGEGADARHVVVRDAAVEEGTVLPPYTVLTGGVRAAGVSE